MSALVPDLIVKPTPAEPSHGPQPSHGPRAIVGLTRPELGQALADAGVPAHQIRMRTTQVWRWIYGRGSRDFADMTDLAKEFRSLAAERFVIDRPAIVAESHSSDGTIKWLLRFSGGAEAETVYIPDADRGTLCLSSQVGCTLTCSFCHTGTQRWVRNLTAGEIVGQIMLAKDRLEEWDMARAEGTRVITNVVMMGMGEPLYNFDNVKAALAIASDNEGLSLSKRRITLSTAGVVPMMARAGEEIGTMLAISLHAVEDGLRDTLVPLNRRYPIAELMEACRTYPGVSNAKRITFEYVMLDGVNDSPAEARALVRLIDRIPAKINLIPFNPWPGAPYRCSSWEAIERFADILFDAGYASPVRTPRGRDIMAACGQLKSATEKARASEIRRSARETAENGHLPR